MIALATLAILLVFSEGMILAVPPQDGVSLFWELYSGIWASILADPIGFILG